MRKSLGGCILLLALLPACGPAKALIPRSTPTTTYTAHNVFTSPDCAKQQGLGVCAQLAANAAGIPVAWSTSPAGFDPEVMSAIWQQKGQAHEQWQRGAISLDVNSGDAAEPGRVVREFRWNGTPVTVRLQVKAKGLPGWLVVAAWRYQGRTYDVIADEMTLDPGSAGRAKRWQSGLTAVLGLFRTLQYASPE